MFQARRNVGVVRENSDPPGGQQPGCTKVMDLNNPANPAGFYWISAVEDTLPMVIARLHLNQKKNMTATSNCRAWWIPWRSMQTITV